jgi:hypothetical protein
MVTIVWKPNSFHSINVLAREIKFNANHRVPDVLVPLLEWHKTQIRRTDRKLIVHADNAHPHTAGMTLEFQMRRGGLSAQQREHLQEASG